jgi:hypothetical protein
MGDSNGSPKPTILLISASKTLSGELAPALTDDWSLLECSDISSARLRLDSTDRCIGMVVDLCDWPGWEADLSAFASRGVMLLVVLSMMLDLSDALGEAGGGSLEVTMRAMDGSTRLELVARGPGLGQAFSPALPFSPAREMLAA